MPRRIVTGDRLAIRTFAQNGEVLLLAVPPMRPGLPRTVRQQVFEYVLRRQPGMAWQLADTAADELDGVEGSRARLASLMSATPHRNQRGMAVAA
jgi:hypothetical protein